MEDRIPIPSSLFDDRKYARICTIISEITGGDTSLDLYVRSEGVCSLCAIKHSKTTSRDENSGFNFRREVQILSSNEHPSIIRLFHYGSRSRAHKYPNWMELEFIPGGTVFNLISASVNRIPDFPPLDATRMLIILYGVASALAFLHSRSVVHRDVRSANILLDHNMEPRLADFEFAHRLRPGEQVESPRVINYAAPELVKGSSYTEKVDVYSFGMLIYELRTRETPYGDTAENRDIAKLIIAGNRPALPAIDPYFHLYQACTAPQAVDRPSMKDVAIRLDELSRMIPGIELKKYLIQKFRIEPKRPQTTPGDVGTIANLRRTASFLPKAMYQVWALWLRGLCIDLTSKKAQEHLKRAVESGDWPAMISHRELIS